MDNSLQLSVHRAFYFLLPENAFFVYKHFFQTEYGRRDLEAAMLRILGAVEREGKENNTRQCA
jgi:hypothetical protein